MEHDTMARFSKSAQGMKLESGDIVSSFGVKGKVLDIILLRSENLPVGMLVMVDFTRGTGSPSIMNLCDIEAVKFGAVEWVDLKGETITVS